MPYTEDNIGFQKTDTSEQAAYDIATDAPTIRRKVLAALHASIVPLTSEEIANKIELPYASVQPRLSELRTAGRVEDSGIRKIGRYGKQIIAWKLR